MVGTGEINDDDGMPSDFSESESQSSDDDLPVKSDTDYIHFVNAYMKHPKLKEVVWVHIVTKKVMFSHPAWTWCICG